MTSNVVLIGYMGCGKSTVGKQLAAILSKSFVDLDNYIEVKERNTISNIFKEKGEVYFRKIERKYLLECLGELEDSIISLGGGTPCFGDNMQIIINDTKSTSIYLRTGVATLSQRLFAERSGRPLIAHTNSIEELSEFIGKHLFERNTYYSQAEYIETTDDKAISTIVKEIVDKMH